MDNLKKNIITFSKAQFSAWIASAIDFGTTLLLAQLCGVWYAYATFIGAVVGGIVNCSINYKWVFNSTKLKKKYVMLRYFIVWGISIALNTFGTYAVTEITNLNFIIIKAAVAIAVAIIWNYQMQRLFVFKKI